MKLCFTSVKENKFLLQRAAGIRIRMTPVLSAFLSGFALSAALIVAIGAQNLFVLRQGLLGVMSACRLVIFFGASDAMLIAAGVGGMGPSSRRRRN